ncbi:hypothetical protein [Burkholderia cepacia]|uniref:hypothetical protein n=1 Tax=Burkholderia cepacia TaxID=292 RepID=UPI00158AC61C|nr:hypothetical protein [Burkholderia cepacia]
MTDPMSERYKLSDDELRELINNEKKNAVTNDFRPIDQIAPLDAEDMACFTEIRDILKKYGKLERFGITLLHKHFDINQDEVLIETVNSATRSMKLQPQIIDPSDVGMLDTQWYLGSSIPLSVVKCRTNWHS